MKSRNQSYIIYLLLFSAIIVMIFFTVNQQSTDSTEIPFNELAEDVKAGEVDTITEDESYLEITYKNSDAVKTSTKDPNTPLVAQLLELGVTPEQLAAEKYHDRYRAAPVHCWPLYRFASYVSALPDLYRSVSSLFSARRRANN